MLRIGLLGCGRHGERYLRHLARGDVAEARPVALWRRDPEARARLAAAYGVEACVSMEELLSRRDVDAIAITTPPGSHRAEVSACLAAGLPTLVEKPFTTTVEDALDLLERARSGPPLMVAQSLRYNPTLRAVRELWPRLGVVHRIRMAQRLEPSPLAWQREESAAGGGSLHLTGVHLFDALRWLVGRTPDAVQCLTHCLQGHPFENLFDACFEWSDIPLLAATEISKFSSSRASRLDAVGTRAQLFADYAAGGLELVSQEELPPPVAPEEGPTLPALLTDFVRVARGEIPSPIDAVDGVESVRMIVACRRSAAERRVVALREIPALAVAPDSHS